MQYMSGHPSFGNPASGIIPDGYFEKNENKTISVSFGDINVKGANSPIETAMVVREELVALFTGEKLRNGVMEWQPIA